MLTYFTTILTETFYALIYTVLSLTIQVDRGSVITATFLCAQFDDLNDPVDSVFYGPSTQNKI